LAEAIQLVSGSGKAQFPKAQQRIKLKRVYTPINAQWLPRGADRRQQGPCPERKAASGRAFAYWRQLDDGLYTRLP